MWVWEYKSANVWRYPAAYRQCEYANNHHVGTWEFPFFAQCVWREFCKCSVFSELKCCSHVDERTKTTYRTMHRKICFLKYPCTFPSLSAFYASIFQLILLCTVLNIVCFFQEGRILVYVQYPSIQHSHAVFPHCAHFRDLQCWHIIITLPGSEMLVIFSIFGIPDDKWWGKVQKTGHSHGQVMLEATYILQNADGCLDKNIKMLIKIQMDQYCYRLNKKSKSLYFSILLFLQSSCGWNLHKPLNSTPLKFI